MVEWEGANMLEGLSSCLKDNLKKLLEGLGLDKFIDELTLDQDKLDEIVEKYKEMLKEKVEEGAKQTGKSISNAQMKKIEAVANESHIVQEARTSVKYTEQLMSETKFTKPVDLPDTDYTTQINYPDRYGHIDTVKNWFVVDKIEKYIEAVSSSGSLFHIDREGNVSIHITGNLKFIVDGDVSFEGRANMDTVIKGSSYKHIGGRELDVTGGVVDKISGAGQFNYTGSINASGSIIDAGGNTPHHSH